MQSIRSALTYFPLHSIAAEMGSLPRKLRSLLIEKIEKNYKINSFINKSYC